MGSFTDVVQLVISQPLNAPGVNQSWNYRFRVTNCSETIWAAPSVLIPGQTPPAVNAIAGPSDVGSESATLNGALTAGGAAHLTLYWGTTDPGPTRSGWDAEVALGPQPVGPVSQLVTGLLYGLSYVYRLRASNDFGEAWSGPVVPFKTPSPHVVATEGLLAHQYDTIGGTAQIDPVSTLQAQVPDGVERQITDIRYNSNFSLNFSFITAENTFSMLWEGVFRPTAGAGIYTFGMEHDDRAILALDLNHDGDFDDGELYDSGELVVDGVYDDDCCGFDMGEVYLEDREVRIAIAMEQTGGGARMDARWSAGAVTNFLDLHPINGASGAFFDDFSTDVFELRHQPVSGLTLTTANLHALYRGAGAAFDLTLFWGPADGGTNEGAWANNVNLGWLFDLTTTNLTHPLNGLTPDTTYSYAFRMTNCQETRWAQPSGSFQTLGPPVVDHASGADIPAPGLARLNGTLLNGGAADVTIYWGPTDGGTTPAAWDFSLDLGSLQSGPFSGPVSGLLFGQPYHYRAFASNI
ncbi:MAG: hypothetical protein AAF492_18635, partial [Verrucomicrobiota bacterium]